MGAQETKTQGGHDFKSYMESYIDKGKVNDKHYGEGKIVQSKATKTTMFVKEYTTNDESSFKQQVKKFEERCKLKHPNLIELQGFTHQTEPQFCSTIYKTYLLFEYCTKNLDGDIVQRKLDNSRYYSVEEMWRVTQCYISGFSFLQSRRLYHGDVKLTTLFISNSGEYKVAEQGMLNPNSSFAQLISGNSKDHKGIYLSPLLLKAVETLNLRPKHSIFKSDVFSLGVCLIHAALLESCDDIYNFNKFTINEMVLEEKLEKMKLQYPMELVSTIQQMVQLDEKNRMDFNLLEKHIENQKKLFLDKYAESQPPREEYQSDSNKLIQSNNVPITSTYYQEDKVYREPVVEKVITFKQESNHSSPQFETNQYRQIPETTFNFNYNEPFDIQRQSVPHEQQTVTINYQINEPKEEMVKRSFQPSPGSFDNRDTVPIKTTEISMVSKPFEGPIKVQESNNYRSVADYPVNYDDINSLLKKYGIEPLQPLHTSQSPAKGVMNSYTTTSSFKNEPPQTTIYNNNDSKFQNYSEILRNYDEKKPQEVIFEKKEEKPGYFNEIRYEPESFQRQNEQKPGYNYNDNNRYSNDVEPQKFVERAQRPEFKMERREIAKRHGFDEKPEEISQPVQNYQDVQYKYEYKPSVFENAEFNSSVDFYTTYNRPSDINAQAQNRYDVNVAAFQQTQKPSLYDNVSFANEFFDNRGHESNSNKLEEHKKKSSIHEMKKSLNQETKEVVIENYQNGAKYEGEKYKGMRHGKGRFFYSDGGVYDGEWKENRMFGKGILYYGSGKIAFEGDWIDDKFEGQGILYNENPVVLNDMFDFRDFDNIEDFWVKYEGGFINDNKEGYGVLYLTNGEKFVGYFKEDNLEGRGMYYQANGELVSGMWRSNKFVE